VTAEACFNAKAAMGRVSQKAAKRIRAILQAAADAEARGDAVGNREAMQKALAIASHEAAAKQARTVLNAERQLAILSEAERFHADVEDLRRQGKAPLQIPWLSQYQGKASELWLYAQSKLYGDALLDLGNRWNNVYYLARSLRGEAHAKLRTVVAELRPKMLGLKREAARELDLVDGLYGQARTPEVEAQAAAAADALEFGRVEFNKAAGYEAIPYRKGWGLPNPPMSAPKMLAWAPEPFIDKVATLLDRAKMIDFRDRSPLSDARLREVLRSVWETGRSGGLEGGPSAGFVGEGPLSDARSFPRTLVFKDADSWNTFNELFGRGAGPFDAIVSHLHAITHDAAIMRVFGPDPLAAKRLIESMMDREAARLGVGGDETDGKSMAAAVKANAATAARVEAGKAKFQDGWANMMGGTGHAVDIVMAERMGTVRNLLASAQLGTSIISALSDGGLAGAAAKMNGLPLWDVFRSIGREFATKGSEIEAAQAGLVLDTLAHGAREADIFMDQSIRGAVASKLATGVIRSIGHRVWTAKIRDGFALEFMAKMAAAIDRKTPFADLSFRPALEKYGIDEAAWRAIGDKVQPFEPRPGATLLRPMDVRATPGLESAGEALGRMIQTELDYSAIEGNPMTRRIVMGSSRPGTLQGEVVRSLALYRSWPLTTMNIMINRTFARGWDGSRLAHGAGTFLAMTLFGALAMELKQIVSGRDPKPLDPTTKDGLFAWGHAIVQGGGLGVFGDMLAADKTRDNGSWAAMLGGPILGLGEDVLGKFLLANVQRAANGQPTNFLGEALWTGSRYLPGTNIFWAKLAFQRAVTDQLLLWADPKTPERFARMEANAKKNFGQGYWWKRGQMQPDHAPDIGAVFGR
jgi:hypothetical protein